MKAAPTNRRRKAKPARASQSSIGLTLMELLLSLTVACLVAAGVATMLYFTSYATSKQGNTQDLLIASEFLSARINESIQRSRMVLARGSDYLVLWSADTNGNGSPELSELRRIERNSANGSVVMYKAPTDVTPDPTYSLSSTNFDTVTNAVKGTASFPGLVWGTASSWYTVLDNATVQQANYVGWRITVASNSDSETVIGGAALRN